MREEVGSSSGWLQRWRGAQGILWLARGSGILVVLALLAWRAHGQTPAAPAQAAPNPAAQAQAQPKQPLTPEQQQVREARRLTGEGKYDEAVAKCRELLEKNPNLYEAYAAAGVALDLKGDYAEARHHLQRAIELAKPEQKAGALRSMAMSYAFEKKAKDAAQYEQQVIDADLAKQPADYAGAADVTNELARVYLESGDIANAEKTYRAGWETIQKKPDLSPEERALWEFRWENAEARIASRRGKKDDAAQHVAAAKAQLDKMSEQDRQQQQRFFSYLTGYVAFYTADYKQAIADLTHADELAGSQRDPFVLVLLAQAYEKSGDMAKARELYEKVLSVNAHNPTGAFSRPLAREKVGGTSSGGGIGGGGDAYRAGGGGIGSDGGVFRVGKGGVSAPRAIYAPDPEYSQEARAANYQGTVVLWCVIGADGRVRDIRVQRSIGRGLDEKAIEAVKKWKFKPAKKDGVPVAVQINVEVNFRL